MVANTLIFIFGVLLPAVALIIELYSGICAEMFFDPIPTLGHVLLVAFVPLANFLAIVKSTKNSPSGRGWILWLNAVAIGVSLVYTIVFLSLVPMAVIAIIAFGLGLLPLAPLSSLICEIILRIRLTRMSTPEAVASVQDQAVKRRGTLCSLLCGGALGMALLLACEARIALTIFCAEAMLKNPSGDNVRWLNLLRNFGDRDCLMRMCYQNSGNGGFGDPHRSFISSFLFSEVPQEDARLLYFRVTGVPFNSVPPSRGVRRDRWDEFDFDPDLGGTAVAGRQRGLSLSSSRIDAQLHPEAAAAYVEWTMIFKNDNASLQREARAQVILPPGGVVSRVTLWVDGEPREAAFAGTAQVREAYRKVAVQQRCDPLLVSYAGNDRVMFQCFPIQPQGEMKIRLGITAPMILTAADNAVLRLPCFAEGNFNITDEKIHSVWCESDRQFIRASDRLRRESPSESKFVLRGFLADRDLSDAQSAIATQRSPTLTECWTHDLTNKNQFVLQKIAAAKLPAKKSS